MNTQPIAFALLDDACEKLLDGLDLYSAEHADSHLANVFTSDGDHRFTVTKAISVFDLRALISFGRVSRAEGESAGREAVAEGLRSLIGASKAA